MQTNKQIIRRPDRAEGGITPEEKKAMDAHAEKWNAIAMRTDPIEPEKIIPAIKGLYDEQNRPHCETGPSHEWRDGWKLYHWHGVKVPAHWIEGDLDPNEVIKADNVEQRAAGIEIVGMRRMLDAMEHTILDSSSDPEIGDLIDVRLQGLPDSVVYLKFLCPRNGEMMEAVDKDALEKHDLHHAHAWHARIPARLYSKPNQRS